MVWQPEIDEIEHRKRLAENLGGEENVARHHARGKLTVRERIAGLADPGSFQEIGKAVGGATYEDGEIKSFTPAPEVAGVCTLNGRRVVVNGGDFTIRGGASDAMPHGSMSRGHTAIQFAMKARLPYIMLLDAAGGSVRTFEHIGRTYAISNMGGTTESHMLGMVPVVAGVMGSVAGLPAVQAAISHFSVMIKDTSVVFPGGPPVVKAALGYDITKEELGDYRTQVYGSGAIDNLAENEEEAFGMIRQFLSYLPDNVWQMPPRIEPTDDPNRRDEELLSIMPRDRRWPYDPYEVLNHILDRDSFFEICPFYGESRIVGLARANGYPFGVMINNPNFLGGSMDVTAGEKTARFLKLCNTFHLPLVYFVDEPGFMVGLKEQKKGIVRAGARILHVTTQTTMPWLAVVISQLYGVSGQLNLRPTGMYRRYAWPSGNWGSMHIEGGAQAAYRREIDAAPDPEAKRKEIEQRLKKLASPFRTAEAFSIEDIIDPRDTRPLLCDFIETAQSVLKTQLGPVMVPMYEP